MNGTDDILELGSFTQTLFITTNITEEIDQNIKNQYKKHLLAQFTDTSRPIILGGGAMHPYPDLQITGQIRQGVSIDMMKYFSFVTTTNINEPMQFMLRKGPHIVDNQTLLVLNQTELKVLVQAFKELFFPYLLKISNMRVGLPKDVPDQPKAVVIGAKGETQKIVMQLDDVKELVMNRTKNNTPKIYPNMHVRMWQKHENAPKGKEWFRTMRGVTMTPANFHLFIKVLVEDLVPEVGRMFENIKYSLNKISRGNNPNLRPHSEAEDEVDVDFIDTIEQDK